MSSNPAISIGVTATDTTRQVLRNVDQKVKQTTNIIETESNRAVGATNKLGAAFQANAGTILTSVAGMGAGITSLAITYNNLEDVQIAVAAQETALARASDTLARRHTSVEQAALSLAKAQDRLKNLQESGKATAEQLAFAQEDLALKTQKLADQNAALATDQQNLETTTMRLKDAQDNVNETWAQFLANVPSQVFSFGFGTIAILKLMGKELDLASAKAALFGSSASKAFGALNGAMAATGRTATQTGLAMRFAFLTNPVGIALLGISTAAVLVATNVGGIRDRFFEFGRIITQFLDVHFKPLADAIRWFNDNVLTPLGQALGTDMPADIAVASESMTGATETTEAYAVATQRATSETKTFDDYLQNLGTCIVKQRTENEFYLRSVGAITDATRYTNEQLELMAEYLQDTESATKRLAQDNFNFIASAYGVETAIQYSPNELAMLAANKRKSDEFEQEYGAKELNAIMQFEGNDRPSTDKQITDYLNKITFGAKRAALGYDGMVNRPTLFLAGEAGPEHVKVTPKGGKGRQKRSMTFHFKFKESGREWAKVRIDDIDAMYENQSRNSTIDAREGNKVFL